MDLKCCLIKIVQSKKLLILMKGCNSGIYGLSALPNISLHNLNAILVKKAKSGSLRNVSARITMHFIIWKIIQRTEKLRKKD